MTTPSNRFCFRFPWLPPLLLGCLLCGCTSPTQKIARSTQEIRRAATVIHQEADTATEVYEVGGDPRPALTRIKEQAVVIEKTTATVTDALGGVQDKPDWWTQNLWMLAVIVVVGATLYLGSGFIKPFLTWMGAWIPNRTRRTAELDVKGDSQAATALRRANEPGYEKAYRKAKAKLAEGK